MTILSTVRFRRADIQDIPILARWSFDNDCYLTLFRGSGYTPQKRELFLARKLVSMCPMYSTQKLFMIDTNNHSNIGTIYFCNIDWRNQNLTLEAHIDNKYQGTPIVWRILIEASAYAFDEFNMHKVLLYILSNNDRSLKLFRHHTPEVIFKNHLQKDGQYVDLYAYAIYKNLLSPELDFIQNKDKYLSYGKKLYELGYITPEIFEYLLAAPFNEQHLGFYKALNAFRLDHGFPCIEEISEKDLNTLENDYKNMIISKSTHHPQ